MMTSLFNIFHHKGEIIFEQKQIVGCLVRFFGAAYAERVYAPALGAANTNI